MVLHIAFRAVDTFFFARLLWLFWVLPKFIRNKYREALQCNYLIRFIFIAKTNNSGGEPIHRRIGDDHHRMRSMT